MAQAPGPARNLGHYRVLERIGTGGMGDVYRARDERLQRDVAVKLLPAHTIPDQSSRKRFREEALALARLNHPSIGTVLDFDTVGDTDFLVMEYVQGETLAQKIAASGPLPDWEFTNIAIQVSSALQEAHQRGVIHCDLKPGNIMVTPAGQAKVLDFGLAKLMPGPDDPTRDLLTDSTAKGTLPYMAPEVLRERRPDPRSDVYSLGVVLYEMATGHGAFKGSLPEILQAILSGAVASPSSVNPQISPELDGIIRKAMDRDPALRYQSAGELAVDLRRLGSGTTPSLSLPGRRGRRLRRLLAQALVVVVLLVVMVVVLRRASWIHSSIPQPRLIAVLPIQPIGGGAEDQALCRGLTELVTARLAQASSRYGIDVVPSSDVRSQAVVSAEDARKKLGASHVVEGSWDFTGQGKVMYALVDTTRRRNLDAAVVQADVADLPELQANVIGGLFAMLDITLPSTRSGGQPSRQAFQYYVRGRGHLLDYQQPASLESAVALFQRALELDQNFALAHAGLAEAYWRRFEDSKDEQWLSRAREECDRAAVLDDTAAEVHATRGLIEQGTGRYEDAVRDFKRSIELEPTMEAPYRGLAASYESLGDKAEAESTYWRAIEVRKANWSGYQALGLFYYRAGRYEDAVRQFQRVIDLAPENIRGYTNLGGVYYYLGQYQRAEELFQKSLVIEANTRAYSNLGTLYFFQGRYADAARKLERAVQLNDRDYRLWMNLARSYFWAPGEREKAGAAYERAARLTEQQVSINPRDPKLQIQLGDCYAMLQRPAEARALLRKALAQKSVDTEDKYDAAQVWEQLGDRTAALTLLEQALREGFSAEQVERSPSLQKLRADPRYKALLETIERSHTPAH